MDVHLARTLLAIVETGSFKDAAGKLNLTQSTISARVRTLEDTVGRRLLERSKSGVQLTPAGEQFYRHATGIVRIWQQALLEMAVASVHGEHVAIGASVSLWEGFLMRWIVAMRRARTDIAISASHGDSAKLISRVAEGTLDLAVVYRALQRPGLRVEHLFDEAFVLVASRAMDARMGLGDEYVFVNWGPEFAADHAEAYPDHGAAGVRLELGAIGINYLFDASGAGYFPLRVAAPYIASGRLHLAKNARRFVYPVYVAMPEQRDDELYGAISTELRKTIEVTDGVQGS